MLLGDHLSGMAVDPEKIAAARKWIGERVRYARGTYSQFLMQYELAEAAGVDRSWLINVEKGHENYTIETLIAIVLACGLTIEEFFLGPKSAGEVDSQLAQNLDTVMRKGTPEMQVTIRTTLQTMADAAIRNRAKGKSPPKEEGLGGRERPKESATLLPKKKQA